MGLGSLHFMVCEGDICTRENEIAHKALVAIEEFLEFKHTDNNGNLCTTRTPTLKPYAFTSGRDPVERAVIKCFKTVYKYFDEKEREKDGKG